MRAAPAPGGTTRHAPVLPRWLKIAIAAVLAACLVAVASVGPVVDATSDCREWADRYDPGNPDTCLGDALLVVFVWVVAGAVAAVTLLIALGVYLVRRSRTREAGDSPAR